MFKDSHRFSFIVDCLSVQRLLRCSWIFVFSRSIYRLPPPPPISPALDDSMMDVRRIAGGIVVPEKKSLTLGMLGGLDSWMFDSMLFYGLSSIFMISSLQGSS